MGIDRPLRCASGLLMLCIILAAGADRALAQYSPGASPDSASANPWVSGSNLVQPPGLPQIGKWMLGADGSAAHWLRELYQGKRLREPINVIIIDESADSSDSAKLRLIRGASAAGYPIRMGHSSGYQGHLGGQLYTQIPSGWDDAFSDEPFEFSNNHGRVFGPHKSDRGYIMIGAFSREEVVPFRWPGHRYASFNQARDDFARRLDQTSEYKVIGYVSLENAISGDAEVTTGDHDGRAVLLRSVRR